MTYGDMAEEIRKTEGANAGDTANEPKKTRKPPVIHVIPDEFYGAAMKRRVKVSEPKKDEKPAEKAKSDSSSDKSEGKPERPLKSGVGKGRMVLLVILGLMLLSGIGLIGYYFLFMSGQPNVPPAIVPPVVEQPKTVCGDGRCEDNETSGTCSDDCGPETSCGDGTCDELKGETYGSCPADCEAPEPVCGDGVCDEAIGEDYESCPADCERPQPSPSPDTDSDGMTDIEETEIYGTNPLSPDTDGDSYVDLNELLNMFNPALPQPSILADNPGIDQFEDKVNGFTVLYPSAWKVTEEVSGTSFRTGTSESITISIDWNETKKSLMDWYLERNPGMRSSAVQVFQTKQGYEEIVDQDQMTSYLFVDGNVFIVRYDLGTQLKIRYKATFKMMINSLEHFAPQITE